MTAIETSATPMTSMAGAAADVAAAGPVIRSAWLAPGFYLAFLFGALFLFAIGLLLLWRSAKNSGDSGHLLETDSVRRGPGNIRRPRPDPLT
ncbi:hypothetical protein QP175_10325 [Sphingomonas aerolata]|uniref:hypothetical protein n=1 Tax=Sphingomonas aerolata TaxID=185951 RepID=UPI002FE29C10